MGEGLDPSNSLSTLSPGCNLPKCMQMGKNTQRPTRDQCWTSEHVWDIQRWLCGRWAGGGEYSLADVLLKIPSFVIKMYIRITHFCWCCWSSGMMAITHLLWAQAAMATPVGGLSLHCLHSQYPWTEQCSHIIRLHLPLLLPRKKRMALWSDWNGKKYIQRLLLKKWCWGFQKVKSCCFGNNYVYLTSIFSAILDDFSSHADNDLALKWGTRWGTRWRTVVNRLNLSSAFSGHHVRLSTRTEKRSHWWTGETVHNMCGQLIRLKWREVHVRSHSPTQLLWPFVLHLI